MPAIIDIIAREILDSRGNPTVEVEIKLEDGSRGRASVPSGASRGSFEAWEKRDNDSKRFHGKGVTKALEVVETEIFPALRGLNALEQRHIDSLLIRLDGTKTKERLGANIILGISLALAKAAAKSLSLPLYRYIGGLQAYRLPVPLINILNGGAHASNGLDFQEFMIVPFGATSFAESLRKGCEVFHTLKEILRTKGYHTHVGDEGGFAPSIKNPIEALDLVMQAIQKSGYESDIVLALDIAATELYEKDRYVLKGIGKSFTTDEMITYYQSLIQNYPIISLEDGLAEEDWPGWQALTATLGDKIQIVGDDLFVTNPERVKRGITEKSANALLVKPNQIGTLTETLDTVELALRAGYRTIISHRSGETEDTTIADLAIALNCGQIKTGAVSRADRTAKYNQLLRIEEELGPQGIFAGSTVFQR